LKSALRPIALTLGLILGGFANATDHLTQGEVYAAVLKHLTGNGVGQKPGVIAISSQTMAVVDGYNTAGRPTSLEEDITFRFSRASKATIQDLLIKANDSRDVRFAPPQSFDYRFLPERDIASVIGTNEDAVWRAFAERNGDARYIVRFSAVGFSTGKSEALVYVQWHCPGFCGGGEYVLLKRTTTGWRVLQSNLLWVS
jgi:hypothetical protein